MSNLLEQASLVLIPSGYKEDVVYSQIPLDGSGDLAVSRASNGTRINSAGLVEVCPWNEAQQSNTFGTSPWSNTLDTGATLTYTANYGTAPDGTATAGRLQMALNGSNYAQKNQIISVITGQQYTYSVWIKSLSGTKSVIFCYDNTNNITASVTTEWQRFTHTFTGNSQVYARFVLEAGTSTSVDLLIYGAQLNIGSTAKPYFPTTDRLNVPRLTYQNGGGGCPSLLLEKQSTNLALYSEQFDNSSGWTPISGSGGSAPVITANYGISPDGTQNADRIQLQRTTGAGSYSVVYQPVGISVAQNYTYSVWLKSLSGTPTIQIGVGQVTLTNQWVRYTQTVSHPIGTVYPQFAINTDDAGTSLTADFLAWGFQLEASSYPTSYIPTTSASATRVADACFKTGISSLIPTEGTLFCDFTINGFGAFTNICGLDNIGTDNATVRFWSGIGAPGMTVAGVYAQIFYAGNVLVQLISTTPNERIKGAIRYKSGDVAVYVNGVQIFAGTSTFTPVSLNQLTFTRLWGNPEFANTTNIKEAVIFPVLTNAELASLTTI